MNSPSLEPIPRNRGNASPSQGIQVIQCKAIYNRDNIFIENAVHSFLHPLPPAVDTRISGLEPALCVIMGDSQHYQAAAQISSGLKAQHCADCGGCLIALYCADRIQAALTHFLCGAVSQGINMQAGDRAKALKGRYAESVTAFIHVNEMGRRNV